MNLFKLKARAAVSLLLLLMLSLQIATPAFAMSVADALAIAYEMKANSDAWHIANANGDKATCEELHKANEALAQEVRDAGGSASYNSAMGTWSITLADGTKVSSKSNGKTGHAEEVNYSVESGDGEEQESTEEKGSHYYDDSIEQSKEAYKETHPNDNEDDDEEWEDAYDDWLNKAYNNDAREATEQGVSDQNSDIDSAAAEVAVLKEILELTESEADLLQEKLEESKLDYVNAKEHLDITKGNLHSLLRDLGIHVDFSKSDWVTEAEKAVEAALNELMAKSPKSPDDYKKIEDLQEAQAMLASINEDIEKMNDAHDEAEALRGSYGYTGDSNNAEDGGYIFIEDVAWDELITGDYLYFTIKATASANGQMLPTGTFSRMAGSDVKFTIDPNDGYYAEITHSHVDAAGNPVINIFSVCTTSEKHTYVIENIHGDHTVHVEFKKSNGANTGNGFYKIVATAGEHGTIYPSGEFYVAKGSTVVFDVYPDEGYYVDRVTDNNVNKGSVTQYTIKNITGDHTLHATFKNQPQYYDVTAVAGEGGKIDPTGTEKVVAGSNRTFTITADTGYRIDRIVDNGKVVWKNSDSNGSTTNTSYGYSGSQARTSNVRDVAGSIPGNLFFDPPSGNDFTTPVVTIGNQITNKTYTISNIQQDHEIIVVFASNSNLDPSGYIVTFDLNGHGSPKPSAQVVTPGGKAAEPTAPTATGYIFGGWYKDANGIMEWDFSMDAVFQDTTLYAKWVKAYTVRFNLNGHGSPQPEDQQIRAGGKAAEPTAPTETGYTFGGWYKDRNCTQAWDFSKDTVTQTVILYAKWTKDAGTSDGTDDSGSSNGAEEKYTVKFNLNGHGSPQPADQNVQHGGKVTKPANPSETGYTFDGWYKDKNCTQAWDFDKDTVTQGTTLYAKWTINTYKVSFDLNGHGSPKPADQNINHGSKVTKPTNPTETGYTFGGWYKDKDCTQAWDFSKDTVTQGTTLYAKWTIKTYKVSFNLNGHGSPQPADQNVQHGGKITKPTDPSKSGYTFGGWYKDSNCTTPWNFGSDTVTAPTTLYAKWSKNPSISDLTSITVTPAGKSEYTKSGYGIGCEVAMTVNDIEDLTQLVVMVRNSATGNIFTLEMITENGITKWVMPQNPDSKIGARVDYLPVELPDGEYQFDISISYEGTVISTGIVKYTVEGVMYDDDFTGDRA